MSPRRKPTHRNQHHRNQARADRAHVSNDHRSESNFVRCDGIPLIISRGVRRRLTPAGLAHLAAMRNSTFTCLICKRTTRFGPNAPATVVVVHAPPARVCAFAHPHCAPSRVFTTPPLRAGDNLGVTDLTTSIWVRPSGCQPRVVLIWRSAQNARWLTTEPGELDNPFLAGLVDDGFALLTDMEDPFPILTGLEARIDGHQLAVTGPHHPGPPLITCPLLPHTGPPWYQPAFAEGLGIVMLAGANPDPTVNALDELELGIYERRAVAATARLITAAGRDPSTSTHPLITATHPLIRAHRPGNENHRPNERPSNDDQRPERDT